MILLAYGTILGIEKSMSFVKFVDTLSTARPTNRDTHNRHAYEQLLSINSVIGTAGCDQWLFLDAVVGSAAFL